MSKTEQFNNSPVSEAALPQAENKPVMLRAQGITKSFGHFTVLKGVNLSLTLGERVILLGPNGAGKSTLMRILAMLARPSAGTLEIAGIPLSEARASIRSLIGIISHLTYLYEDLTARENLHFYGKLYGLSGELLDQRVAEMLVKVGLERRADQRVRYYSRGMQQRLSLARAILHQPPVLLLDEPDTGLDRHAAEMLAQIITEPDSQGQPRTVLMTTHNLERGLALSNRVVVLSSGRIVRETAANNLAADDVQSWYYDAIRR
ncbi:MAG: Heme exporter, ATP-binding protein CcmA [Chloroflexi bacterium]|jgi:heme exporter protein A|nr:Heme exporter, ATP-binding protein CcmA [Chloroflexota bacterium]